MSGYHLKLKSFNIDIILLFFKTFKTFDFFIIHHTMSIPVNHLSDSKIIIF